MTSEADLWERLRTKEKKIVALEREVEELRAALRKIDGIVNWRESIPFTDLHRIARAALGRDDG